MRGLVALLSTREALVLQCVLVAMQQFVNVLPHRTAIAQLAPAATGQPAGAPEASAAAAASSPSGSAVLLLGLPETPPRKRGTMARQLTKSERPEWQR